MREQVYQRAWRMLKKRIQDKTGWGKNEIASLMAECLEDALDAQEEPVEEPDDFDGAFI